MLNSRIAKDRKPLTEFFELSEDDDKDIAEGLKKVKSDDVHRKIDGAGEANVEEVAPTAWQQKTSIFTLLLLYYNQSVILGYFIALELILVEKKADFIMLGILSYAIYPKNLKIFVAPLIDSFYSNKFGKRKTYVVPFYYCSFITLLATSFYIDDLVENVQIVKITIFGFIIVSFMSYKDLTVDGWTVKMLHKNNIYLGTMCQALGFVAGTAIGANFFLFLNSVTFCNDYIWPTPRNYPVISHQAFLLIMGVVYLITGLIIHFCVIESPEPKMHTIENGELVEQDLEGLPRMKFIWTRLFRVLKNKNFLMFLTIIFFSQTGIFFHINTGMIVIQKKGFNKEKISFINLIGLPISAVVMFFGSYLSKLKKELIVYFVIISTCFCMEIWLFCIVYAYDLKENETSSYVQLIIYNVITDFFGSLEYVTMGGFSFRIADIPIAASMVTFCNGLNNLARAWPKTLGVSMLAYMEYWQWAAVSLVVQVAYFLIFTKEMFRLNKLEREDFINKE